MLPNTPTYTRAAPGNLVAFTTSLLAAASASTAFSIGDSAGSPSSALGGTLQVAVTGGATVAATNGLVWTVQKAADTTPNWSPTPYVTGVTVAAVASTLKVSTPIDLPPGEYQLTVTNLDSANAVTYGATLAILA